VAAVRVLTYNVCLGGEGRLEHIAGVIRAARADAVALQEVTSRSNAEELARQLGLHLVFGEANLGVHVAWLTVLGVRRARNHRPRLLAKTVLELEVELGGESLRLFTTHLASRHDPRTPAEEVPAVLDVLAASSGGAHVLVGDLNALRSGDPVGAPPPGVVKRPEVETDPRRAIGLLLDAGYVDCYRTLHPSTPGYTYEARSPWLRLDYVFASLGLAQRLEACDVVRGPLAVRASDHLPVWAEFRL
jgi:endonuclease/exonuclease/phosphatase family metal-dependent hydrolase